MQLARNIYILFAFIFLSSCVEKANDTIGAAENVALTDEIQLTEAQHQSIGISIGKIERREISSTIKANGMLDVPPQNMVTISAVLGGFVKHTELLQGMKVKRGQVVAVMEHPSYLQLQQDYLESKSQLEYYDADYKRQQELARENINASKTLQQAQSNFQSYKAKVQGLKAKLKLININAADLEGGNIKSTVNIYSPIEGYVTQVHVNIGMHVNPSDVLFKIVDTRHLHAEIIVFEKDALKIKMNQRVRFQLSNESTERIAKVYLIGKEISPDRTIRVHCHLENEDENLIPGMYLSALFEAGTGDLPSLPERAIVNFEGQHYAFLVLSEADRKYKMVSVTKGVSESGFSAVEISGDINQSSYFVIDGAYDLLAYLKNTEEEE